MILNDLKTLVEIESPTEDVAACTKVIQAAATIAERVHGKAARIITEEGRPVFWFGAEKPEIILLAHLDTVWSHGSYQPL